MKKLYFLLLALLITSSSIGQTLALSDAPPSGSSITISEEGVNATIDFVTTNFVMSNDSGSCVSDSSGDGYIVWDGKDTSDSSIVDSGCIFTSNDGFEYPISGLSVGNTYLLTAELVDNSGASLVPAVVYTLTVTIVAYVDVANLAALRVGTVSDEVFYRVTGEVINTYSRTNRNQKYFQDATGGILVDDEFFEISTAYNAGAGVTNIRGYLSLFNGLMQFVPTEADWGAATSTGNDITPQVVTLSDIIANLNTYESKLVRFNNVTFADGNGAATFSSSTNYVINDGTASTFRTNFSEADYIGQLIPTGSTSFAAIVGSFNGTPQVTARSLSDMTLSVSDKSLNEFAVFPNPTSLGYVNIFSRNQTIMKVKVFDIIGKQVINETIANNRLNVSSLNTGVYIMRLTQNNATITKKLIIN
ncbi:T9SS type A sorting domain-containing protein [Flavobacteriaceae bacterium AH-315-B10]|nr:T9SS type A sorting domain-containing protein [Flavobacteriaceae bacterium AH-315-B10]